MNEAEKISIITINLNDKYGLEKTIKSVISQTFTNVEFILIDGGSVDGSQEVIRSFNHRIHCWISELDRGIYHAMNKGIERATGQYCLFLNSGDWLVDENVLERCFANEQMADLLIGGCYLSKAGRLIHTYKPTNELTLQSFYGATIPHQATFIKRVLFEQLGAYSETYKIHGDYEFWIRALILHQCTIAVIDTIVTDYNLDGLSNSPAFNQQSQSEIQQILRQFFPERVLADYEIWKVKKAELQLWEWIKSKKMLHGAIHFIYISAIELVAWKRRLVPPKPDQ
ncbi:glycosyltransferase [Spirosoma aureum]|uniref:Glycosyltransferase n=1 Tax=Spirosoma aureum TaxID=2692134 RepID=A0A6G9ANA6_9BACT|nr:glycosyltransferase family 2 protein [Spirosoma aureum]QIP13898.1 glycosyltransferase [Spirosoma aureum]